MPRYQLINTNDPDPVAGFDTIKEARINARVIARKTSYIKGGTWYVRWVSPSGDLFEDVIQFTL